MTTTQLAALYGRISDDPTDTHAGVTRQFEDGEATAKRRELTVFRRYRDDSISALTGKHRPGYEALMRDAEAGQFAFMIVYHLGRLWRNRIERAQGIERLRRAGVSVISVKGPELDLTTATGRGMAGLLGEFDSMESEVKGERVARAALQRAEDGAPNGSIPFGWRRDYRLSDKGERLGVNGDVLHPDEAPIVAEVCRRLLSGEPLIAVTAWLNSTGVPAPGAGFKLRGREHGVTNPDGTLWGKSSVKKLALRPANCGMRMYHNGRPDQRLMEARIEPIISRDDHDRLRAMYGPTGIKARPGGRKHLLTWGVGECGKCGAVLRVAIVGKAPYPKKAIYKCVEECVGRNQASVDELVGAAMIRKLSSTDYRDLLQDDEVADAAINHAAALRARLSAAAEDYADGAITSEQLRTITAKIRPQIAQADQDAATAAPTVPFELLGQVSGNEAGAAYDALPVAQQRVLVEYLIDKVRILPTRPGPGFDANSVEVVWRTAA
jgi:DNA invertase Pin-like site-specific DNA recombinase